VSTRTTPCKALVIDGEVEEYTDAFEHEINNCGRRIDQLGLDAPPGPGIWVWEGTHTHTFYPTTGESDVEFDGTYRAMTEDEAKRDAAGEYLWPDPVEGA
jgi:hypothetical protein